ncbi:hypothetical protein HOY82DRAFT_604210 [Tuber indicum]|nr:hypothetical protein HOY82DRAFT_604210 [Tuber indicum]
MLSPKHLIFQALILTILAALATCSPSTTTDSASNGVSGRSENPNILDDAQFEASGLPLITLDPSADDPNGRVVCETSDASPWIWNSRRLAAWFPLYFRGWWCCNWNVDGGGCSHIMTVEDASTAICGNQGCIRCEDLAMNIYRIGNYCLRDSRAGGVSYLNQGSHVVLY